MTNKEIAQGGIDGFRKAYDEVKPIEKKEPINTSSHSLDEQIKRFAEFSHTEKESDLMDKEVQSL